MAAGFRARGRLLCGKRTLRLSLACMPGGMASSLSLPAMGMGCEAAGGHGWCTRCMTLRVALLCLEMVASQPALDAPVLLVHCMLALLDLDWVLCLFVLYFLDLFTVSVPFLTRASEQLSCAPSACSHDFGLMGWRGRHHGVSRAAKEYMGQYNMSVEGTRFVYRAPQHFQAGTDTTQLHAPQTSTPDQKISTHGAPSAPPHACSCIPIGCKS